MRTVGRARWASLTVQAKREILLGLVLLFAYGFFRQVPAWNEYSRYDLVRAIVDDGTTRIDRFADNTGDKARYGDHWYSDKAPGTALLGVPVYVSQAAISSAAGAGTPSETDSIQALAFVECAIPTAILVLLLIRFLGPVVGEGWATAVGLAYGFGSIAFSFATMFFGHAPAAAALFGSLYVLQGWRRTREQWRPLVAGALAGVAVLVEIPAALGVGVLVLYAAWLGRRQAAAFIVGGIPFAVIFGVYDWISFGNPLSLGYANLAPGGFANGMSQGILGVTWPKLSTLGDLLGGTRGLIRLAPWFVVAPAGILAGRTPRLRAEVVVCAVIAGLFLAYNAGYYLPFGGWTPGPRFLLPALPFAAVLVGLVPTRVRFVAVPLMVAGVAVFLAATVTMPNAPELYNDPLFELWLPRLASGSLADTIASLRWGVHGLMPLAILVTGLAVGLVALAVSFLRPALADRVTRRGSILLGILVVAFALPL
ncbi:MAG TPA: hypothetical protein VFP19_04000 [Candidatus Limnocylindrales bacterium]|nr:hypothetical protein [Candidatus Limnocylindrales bacterium]